MSLRLTTLPPLEEVARAEMEPVDVAALLVAERAAARKPLPLRVGWPMEVDLGPAAGGSWSDVPGGRVWRLVVHSRGALWLVLGFGNFTLQRGGELRIFSPDGASRLGPYTVDDVRPHGQLWTPPLAGETVVVELFWPEALAGEAPRLHLGTVSHGYRAVFGIGEGKGPEPDASGPCEIDVNCPLGADWQDDKRGVVILLSGGSAYCSGSLIASTAMDCAPYVLTAAHCLSSQGSAASTTYRFNYERPACGSGAAPTHQNVSGSNLRATYSASDFTLVELSSPIPAEYQPFFNGWSRLTTPSPEAWGIHHPAGDVKKISRSPNPLTNGSSWGPDHWRVNWTSDGSQGVTEGGSSGSPLFDTGHRIVGQLHGGDSSCSAPPSGMWDEYGKIDVSWTGGGAPSSRLSNWLDPLASGAQTQDGYYCGAAGPGPKLVYRSAAVLDPLGNANGAWDPGERVALAPTVANEGRSNATAVAGTLATSTPGVVLVDAAAAWPDLAEDAALGSLAPHFTLQLDPAFPCGGAIALTLVNTAAESPGTWTSDFTLHSGSASPAIAFDDAMERGPNGWASQSLQGASQWTLTDAVAASPTHSWAIQESRLLTDTVLLMPPLLELGPHAELRFEHRFSTENNYDGGVLEYSADGGAWIDAGPLIRSGGYNGSIVASTNSPLRGRDCWAGESVDWKAVVVDLSSLAGKDVRLRWRFATNDRIGVGAGWAVDDVTVSTVAFSCSPVPPGEASSRESAAPFTLRRAGGGYALAWSAPPFGGAAAAYVLYRHALVFGSLGAPSCEADLGSATSALLPSLSAGQGFLVVARNAAGEGAYGASSAGAERPHAAGGAACP
ncbi:MAG: trypsin-like peptidase domain-containing protein [Acidobacteria bacterium]|nr:trypsin-like peptidase domain-containing protein [Acidobacteriota bacterium]